MITSDEAKELTCDLISIPSVSGGRYLNSAAEYIKQYIEKTGAKTETVRIGGISNIVSSIGKKGGKRLLLNGNFDVVPVGDVSKWANEPFSPSCEGGFIYGRGASDMKSGMAAMMIAFKELKQMENELNGEIVFMAVGDGETGAFDGTKTLLKKFGMNYDGAIIPEPTDFCIESAQRGLRWIEIRIKGRACHAARPHVGRNAIEQCAKIITALKEMKFDVENDIFEPNLRVPTISINKIHGGIQNNVVAEDCKILVDRRMLPGETEEKVLREIIDITNSVLGEGFTAEFEVMGKGWDPYMLDQNEPILTKVKEAYKKITNTDAVVRGKGGCTDASHIFNAGIPVVLLGPGNPNESHTTNEKVKIERIALTAKILVEASVEFLK